jgi:calcium/calmodulin-dependent protein kinase I
VKLVDVSTETQHADDAERNRSETRNETILLRKLNHRNIIKFVEYYESPSTLFVVLELAPLGDLFSNVGCRLFFEQRNIRRIARQLFDGVR